MIKIFYIIQDFLEKNKKLNSIKYDASQVINFQNFNFINFFNINVDILHKLISENNIASMLALHAIHNKKSGDNVSVIICFYVDLL